MWVFSARGAEGAGVCVCQCLRGAGVSRESRAEAEPNNAMAMASGVASGVASRMAPDARGPGVASKSANLPLLSKQIEPFR